ncbi:MAG: cytochrome P450 [Candidatus Margulisiibacteriota bacterium]
MTQFKYLALAAQEITQGVAPESIPSKPPQKTTPPVLFGHTPPPVSGNGFFAHVKEFVSNAAPLLNRASTEGPVTVIYLMGKPIVVISDPTLIEHLQTQGKVGTEIEHTPPNAYVYVHGHWSPYTLNNAELHRALSAAVTKSATMSGKHAPTLQLAKVSLQALEGKPIQLSEAVSDFAARSFVSNFMGIQNTDTTALSNAFRNLADATKKDLPLHLLTRIAFRARQARRVWNQEIRNMLDKGIKQHPDGTAWPLLDAIAPLRYKQLHPNDQRSDAELITAYRNKGDVYKALHANQDFLSFFSSLMFAGHETTLNGIGFLVSHFQHDLDADWKAELIAEMTENQDAPNYLGRTDTRLHQFVTEMLRKDPLVPISLRRLAEDAILTAQDGQPFHLAKGSTCILNMMSYAHNTSVFGSSAAAFSPTPGTQAEDKLPPSFGKGSFACKGTKLAETNLKAFLMALVLGYQLEGLDIPTSKEPKVVGLNIGPTITGTLTPKGSELPTPTPATPPTPGLAKRLVTATIGGLGRLARWAAGRT